MVRPSEHQRTVNGTASLTGQSRGVSFSHWWDMEGACGALGPMVGGGDDAVRARCVRDAGHPGTERRRHRFWVRIELKVGEVSYEKLEWFVETAERREYLGKGPQSQSPRPSPQRAAGAEKRWGNGSAE